MLELNAYPSTGTDKITSYDSQKEAVDDYITELVSKADVIYYLKKAHIPYKSIPCKEVEDGPAKEKAINQYRQAGCRSHLH